LISLEQDGNIYAWNMYDDTVCLFSCVDWFAGEIDYTLLSPADKGKAGQSVTHLFSSKSNYGHTIFSEVNLPGYIVCRHL
jgi:hypothetical protein